MLRVTPVFSRRVYVQPRINSFETAFRKFHAAKPAKLANINGRKTISKPITEKAVTFSGILTLGSFIAWTLCSEEAVACCDAGPIDPIISKVKDFAEATIAPWVQEHGLSGTLGFCSGVAIKRLGRSIVVAIGGMILIAQGLQYSGYVNIDYKKIKMDIKKAVEKHNQDGNLKKMLDHAVEKVNSVLLLYVPDTANYVAGLGLGFYLG